MPTVQIETLPKNSLKLTITVSAEEMESHLKAAITHLAEHVEVPGFRPGKATHEALKNKLGEMAIYEEAVEQAVRVTFLETITANKIEPVGSPAIEVIKMAPGNEFIYTATVALMPIVEQLADYKTLKITKQKVEVEDKEIDLALRDLQRMQTKEVRTPADSTATKNDKVVIDMNIKKDNVPLEGGQTINHSVFMAEAYYLPGFTDQLTGTKEGDKKTFKLEFPKEHYQKHLAGQEVEFEINVKEIFNLQPPELDDVFAASLGQKDLASLKGVIKDNMIFEKESEETLRQERALLELIVKESRFQDIPDLLINEEINKMIEELKHGVEKQGGVFNDYLKSLKKTLPDLKLDFTPQALTRLKIALVVKEIAKIENIKPTEEEINNEIDRVAEHYKNDEKAKGRIHSPVYRDFVETTLRNRKVIDFLKGMMVG